MYVIVIYILWSSDFALYLEDYYMYEHHYLRLWINMTRRLTSNNCRLLWPIFHGPVILRYILKSIWMLSFDVWTSYFGIMRHYDQTFDLKINVGHCDLYFMVQWFCLISWRLFDVCRSYFEIWISMTRGLTSKYMKVIVTYILWSSDFALYLEDYLMYENHYWDYDSLWPDVWQQNKCRSLLPIFHGPVILRYILRTIWCMNIILQDYGSLWPAIWPQTECRVLWHRFHGPVILPYVSKTIWMSVIFSDNETGWPKLWPQCKYKTTWPLVHGLVILSYISKVKR